MGIKTKIEYADSTINPTMGCDGCELWNPAIGVKQCYAGRMTEHYAGRRGWPASFDEPRFFPGRIETRRQRWRALTLAIKAKLETVESGIATFEDEFLAYIVLPNGSTVGEWATPQIGQAYDLGKMPPLLPMPKDV